MKLGAQPQDFGTQIGDNPAALLGVSVIRPFQVLGFG